MNPMRTNDGFSLIMALIAVAILGAVSLAVATLFTTINSQSRHINSVSGAHALISTLQGFISYPNLCFSNLDPSTNLFDPVQAPTANGMPLSFRLGGGSSGPKVEAGSKLLSYDVVVDYLIYRNVTVIGADPAFAGNKLYTGEIALKLKKSGSGAIAGGNELHERALGTLVTSVNDTTQLITSCYALTDARQACSAVGGIYDETMTPKCKLPYPCMGIPNAVFMGYDASGTAQCKTMAEIVGSSCPAGQFLVSNGAGGTICQSP